MGTIASGNKQCEIAGFQHRNQFDVKPHLPRSVDSFAVRIDTHGTTSSSEFNNKSQLADENRLPGEFERQEALLISCQELLYEIPEMFIEIVRHTAGRIAIIALVSNEAEYSLAKSLLRNLRVRTSHVRFAIVPHDTMWTRDYGPIVVYHEEKGPIILDANYDPERPNDDRVPEVLADMFALPLVRVPLIVDGGNLLSNGEGVAVLSDKMLDDNIALGFSETTVVEIMRYLYGFRQIITLESLRGEETGHVDMFAAFTSSDTIVVGAYDPKHDQENATILDRNATRLAEVKMDDNGKRLRVVRIPMPPHSDDTWRTYTNVLNRGN
jgi:agmatine deiminase